MLRPKDIERRAEERRARAAEWEREMERLVAASMAKRGKAQDDARAALETLADAMDAAASRAAALAPVSVPCPHCGAECSGAVPLFAGGRLVAFRYGCARSGECVGSNGFTVKAREAT